MGTIWIDITQILHEFRNANHPTGVSRVILNLTDELVADPGARFDQARVIFWLPSARGPYTLRRWPFGSLAELFPELPQRFRAAGLTRSPFWFRAERAVATSLPGPLRHRLFPTQTGAGLFATWVSGEGIGLEPAAFAPGDCVVSPCTFWLEEYMPALIGQARSAGVPVILFIYDMLLLAFPQWAQRRLAGLCRRGFETLLPQSSAAISISDDTTRVMRRLIPSLASLPVELCRLADTPKRPPVGAPSPEVSDWFQKRYALLVSTFIPHKNHLAAVEAWRRLWRERGEDTPHLLLVGGGEPSPELASALEAEKREGGRVVRLRGVDDASLEALYYHAWLTVYPSLAEGYGMPVAEALRRGKVCLAGDVDGVREAGAGLVDVIDPRDADTIVDKVIAYLADPAQLAAREAEIGSGFRPTTWADTARDVRAVLERTLVWAQ